MIIFSDLAIAHVAFIVFFFSTTRLPPLSAIAAASETPWQPTSVKTTSDGLANLGVKDSNSFASNNLNGTPNRNAVSIIAGSSPFRSKEPTLAIDPAAMLASSIHFETKFHISSTEHPRAHPKPRAYF